MWLPARAARVFLVVLLLGVGAWAEHEPDHRYLILGYVVDSSWKPVTRTEVRAVREKTGLEVGDRTDSTGFFLLIVHLHTEDLGDTIRVLADGASLRIRAQFDPRDPRSHRGTRVDFIGGEAREARELFQGTLRRYLAQ